MVSSSSPSSNGSSHEKQPLMTEKPSGSAAYSAASTSTPLDVPSLVRPMQQLHKSGVNQSLKWRRTQLETMRRMMQAARPDLLAALQQDLGRTPEESILVEFSQLDWELDHIMCQFKEWMQPVAVTSPGALIPAKSTLHPRPITTAGRPAVLIMAPFNYPVSLCLQPAMGALAAGNPVVMKPSELTPTVAAVLERYAHEYFKPDVVRVVTGGVAETTTLLNQAVWGKILFTGSQRVGKIVAAAAGQTLTPVILELGGKSPCYVDKTCSRHLRHMANRIVWGKTINAGQTCVGIDTLVVHKDVIDDLLPHLLDALQAQYHDSSSSSADDVDEYDYYHKSSSWPRIVSQAHAERLMKMIQQVEEHIAATKDKNGKCRILCGSSQQCRPAERYVGPTFVLNPPNNSTMLQEEIFGPLLPIVTVESRQDAIDYMNQHVGKQCTQTPLALYVFTSSAAVFEEIRTACPAAAVLRNDAMVHLGSPFLPFGGLGTSGYGAYHGKMTFDAFSHAQPVVYRPVFPGLDWGFVRGHPFTVPGGNKCNWKGWLWQANILGKLPVIPVLRRSWILAVGAVAVMGAVAWKTQAIPPMLHPAGQATARQLIRLAAWLQSISGGGGGPAAAP